MGELTYPQTVLDNLMTKLGKTDSQRKQDRALVQFENMRPFLDTAARSLLDIGCGFGLIDIHIANHLPLIEEIHLVDGDGTEPSSGSFREDMKAWNDVCVAEAMVRANVRSDIRVASYYARVFAGDFIAGTGFDLVISTRSWGHHYPARTYAGLVRQYLRPGAHVIMDVRIKSDGLDEMRRAGFKCVGQIPDHSLKCKRWIFVAEG